MRAAAAIIGLLGIGSVLAPLGCIGGCTLTEGSLDALALVGGLCLLCVAYGIWQRLLWAWRFGFATIGYAGGFVVVNAVLLHPDSPTSSPLMNISVAILGAWAVSLGLMYSWHRSRDWFVRDGGI
jgi:hypothetical protein